MYLFQRIEEAVFKEHDARRVIGEFVLENREKLQNYTMDEVASLTHTSKSTLVRFAKHFSFSGWTEFSYAFTHEISQYDATSYNDIDPNYPFQENEAVITIIEKIVLLKQLSLKDTSSMLSVDSVNMAVKLIDSAETIIIYGAIPNYYYGELFKRNLLSIHKRAIMGNPGESGMLTSSLSNKDCAIFISYSGIESEYYPTIHVEKLIENSVPIISITSAGNNFLREISDVVLTISSKERLYSKISNFATEESIILILDILYAKLFSLNYSENINKKISNSKKLESKRNSTFKDISENY